MSAGIPVKLLHEAESHVVLVELKSGESYKGTMTASEDSMNCRMKDVIFTAKDGKQAKLEDVYLRGSMIRMVVLPDILKNAGILKKVQAFKNKKKE